MKGIPSSDNPYKPNDPGEGVGLDRESEKYYDGVSTSGIINSIDNDVLYEINVVSNDYNINDVYDRRIYIDARYNTNYNISLYPETIAYFPFQKNFNSTNGLRPLNFLQSSKIIPIIKYYSVVQYEEVGAWHEGYQIQLRSSKTISPLPMNSIYVDPIEGLDANDGFTIATAVKTIAKALTLMYYTSVSDRRNNIIITNPLAIGENINIDKAFTVSIFASTYCYWRGAIRNLSPLNIQGIWLQNSELYAYSDLNLYYCTLDNT